MAVILTALFMFARGTAHHIAVDHIAAGCKVISVNLKW